MMGVLVPKQGVCRFCGAQGSLTGEHVFRDAFNKLLPKGTTGQRLHDSWQTDLRTGTTYDRIHRKFPGRVYDLEVKQVCGDCNHGWMHRLELEVETTLLKMALGKRFAIKATDAEALTRWAVKTALVRELMDAKHLWVGNRTIYDLVRNTGIPDGTRVFVSSIKTPTDGVMHRSIAVRIDNDGILTTTIALESLLMVVITPGSPTARHHVTANVPPGDLLPLYSLWPFGSRFGWPTIPELPTPEFYEVGDLLLEMMGFPGAPARNMLGPGASPTIGS